MYNKSKVNMAWTTINSSTGSLNPDIVRWEELSIDEAINIIKEGNCKGINKCALIHPKDAGDLGCPVDRNVSVEVFKSNPCVYGVCIYKTWNNQVVFE